MSRQHWTIGGVLFAGLCAWSLAGGRAEPAAAPTTRPTTQPATERVIRESVIVPASVEKVWAAWTTREGLKRFFGADAKVELRVGGPFEIVFVPDAPAGSRGSEGCRILSFVPREMLAFSWSAPPSMPEIREERTQVVLHFDELGPQRTRVRLVNVGWGQGPKWDEAFAYFSQAWPYVLASLKGHFMKQSDGKQAETPAEFIYFIEPVRATFNEDYTEDEAKIVAQHFAYLQALLAGGRLILAGRTTEERPTGIVVFEAADLAAAREVYENDPAVKAGLFKGRVAPYRVALSRAP